MQQATVNLFADMGVQPRTPPADLVPATASDDTTPPTSAIVSPLANSVVPAGSTVTITGTASDTGGEVAGVEVSVDGGRPWRRANGRTAWTYAWQTGSPRTVNIRSRAIDDSGNVEAASLGISVVVEAGAAVPMLDLAGDADPGVGAENDPNAVELGVKFRSDVNGFITALRFYKSPQDVGPHVGNLWSASADAAGVDDVRRRDRLGLAGGPTAGADRHRGQHHLRRVLPHGLRLLHGERRLLRAERCRQRTRCTRCADGVDGAERRLPLRRRRRSPIRRSKRPTTGSTWSSRPPIAPDTTPPDGKRGVASSLAPSACRPPSRRAAVFNENLSAASVIDIHVRAARARKRRSSRRP